MMRALMTKTLFVLSILLSAQALALAVPAAPTNLSAEAGDGEAVITFMAGADNGLPITNYQYSFDDVIYIPLSPADASGPITITGLDNGTAYSIRLKAINGVGSSAASEPVSVTPIAAPATTPPTPQITNIDYGDAEIYISISVANNGGSTISSYTATCTDGTTDYTGTSTTSFITVSGLTNGLSYSCSVTATNAAGTSTASASSPPVTLATLPEAPIIDSIAPGNGEAIITFTAGADNGSPITGYRYIKDDGTVTSTILGSTEGYQPGLEFGGSGIALDAAGNIYTSSFYSNNVLKITPDGTSIIFGATGDGPVAIALDAAGNVYTANQGSDDVWKIMPDGTSTSLGPTGGSPSAIAVDAVGNVYAAITVEGACYDYGCDVYCPVLKITPGGTSTILGENAGCYSVHNDIAVDAAGNVYTTGRDKYLLKYTSQPYPTPFGTTGEDPVGIALDSAGNIYTANYGSDNVSKITPDGTSIIFGATGDGPVAIALDAAGNVYTANQGSDDVWKIMPDGTSTIFGPTGSPVFDIAVDAAGNVYTEGENNVSKITDTSTATFAATGDTSPITITGLTNDTEYLMSLKYRRNKRPIEIKFPD
jgi:hypothetical protein